MESQGKGNIGDRLSLERAKAIEILKKSKPGCISLSGAQCSKANKENINENSRANVDRTAYVPFKSDEKSINISDLITDETINLESIANLTKTPRNKVEPKRCESGILFQPDEISGRSTLCNKIHKIRSVSPLSQCSKTSKDVQELLATSFMPEVRAMAMDNKKDVNSKLTRTLLNGSGRTTSTFNNSHSLPRTADMSQISEKSQSNYSCGMFSFVAPSISNDSAFSSEEFAAGELMESKLLKDEISWANNFAVIPPSMTTKEKTVSAPEISFAASISSTIAGDSDFSVGSYFNKRSDNIWDIVLSKSPEKFRTPHALVRTTKTDDVEIVSTTSFSDVESTPKVDNKTYSLALPRQNKEDTPESKSSDDNSRDSYLLSVSAIDRALQEMNINTDVSEDNVINKLKTKGKERSPPRKINERQAPEENKLPNQIHNEEHVLHEFESIAKLISENKENIDPDAIRSAAKMSDTLSFAESLLNCTELKAMRRSSHGNPRSPLSPIEIKVISSSGENDANIAADIDKWPSTPLKAPHCQVRYAKSSSPETTSTAATKSLTVWGEDVKVRSPTSVCKQRQIKTSQQQDASNISSVKSISQGSLTPPPVQSFSSPNPTNHSIYNNTQMLIPEQPAKSCDKNFTSHIPREYSPYSDGAGDKTLTSIDGPLKQTAKTLLSTQVETDVGKSPRSGSEFVSPTSDCFRSPKLNSTNNSDRRLGGLNGGACSTTCSSPVSSDPGQSYGALPTRTTSSASIDSAVVRSISRCSNSSEFSHRDGKVLPLKVTDMELCWGSTKLRANSRKSLQVKNTSDKRLVLRISIAGPGFSLLNLQSSTLAFQSQECRTITVNFSPTVTGAAIGILSFYSPLNATSSNNLPYMELPLYGYGGNAIFQLLNIAKGPIGSAFLTMGEHLVELAHPLVRTIKVHNRGPLLGFALVTIDSSGLHGPRLCDAFEVRPSQMLIQPGETTTVSITFRPKREDIKKIAKKIQAVYTLANMRLIAGDEANRQRMRLLVQRMPNEERLKLTSSSLELLWSRFPGECSLSELNGFAREPTAAASDLMTGVAVHEIALTLNHHESPDNTMESTVSSAFCCFPDGDDTVLFRTVCAASASPTSMVTNRSGATEHKLYPVNELHEATVSSTTTTQSNEDIHDEGGWSVTPNEIIFDFPAGRREAYASLLVRNAFRSRQYFEVTSTNVHLLRFIPSEGYIQPDGGQVEIEVHAVQSCSPTNLQSNHAIFIEVSMENERIRVPVKFTNSNCTTPCSR